jgi:cytosine/uracil/thiamine/allantoin permease
MIASAMINPSDGKGIAWWQSWLCVWIGYSIAACFICMTGRIGAMYHISFPVVARSSFGIWGSLWPVFNRAAMACVSILFFFSLSICLSKHSSRTNPWSNVPSTNRSGTAYSPGSVASASPS